MFSRICLAMLFAAGLTFAQGMGGATSGGGMGGSGRDNGGGMGGGMDGMGGGMPAHRQTKLEMVADKLHLNKDQKEQLNTIVSAALEEARPVSEDLGNGRSAIVTAMIQGKSADELSKMMEQYKGLLAQKAAIEAKAFGKLYAALDPKQQAKAGAVFADQMDGLLDSRGGRGAGRSGRGR